MIRIINVYAEKASLLKELSAYITSTHRARTNKRLTAVIRLQVVLTGLNLIRASVTRVRTSYQATGLRARAKTATGSTT